MDAFNVLLGLDACLGWLLGLGIIGVGVGVVRRAHAGAGYMVAAAGALKLLVNCCAYWPNVYQQVQGYGGDMVTLFQLSSGLALVFRLAAYALLAIAAAKLATSMLARAGMGGAP